MTRRAGIIELSIAGRGPSRGFVFDPHRLALPCWAEVRGEAPSLLVSFDRHFDTVPPKVRCASLEADELERFAREQLDPRNFDHVLAAMDSNVISDAVIVARAKPVGAVTADWQGHAVVHAPTLDLLTAEWGTPHASPEGKRARACLERSARVVLDVDLDCFTTPSDADPTTVIPWSRELIRQFLKPRGSEAFWNELLPKCTGLTFAREPGHCGGLVAGGRLFEDACVVLFEELFEADLP